MSREVVVLVSVLALLVGRQVAAQECRVPLLVHDEEGFAIRYELVGDGESPAFLPGASPRVITAIVPASPGVSGDLVRGNEAKILVLRCQGGEVRVFVTGFGGGQANEVMSAPMSRYDALDVRVNVVAEDGTEAAFWVRNGSIEPAEGPVMNMFNGMPTLAPGDVIVTLEVSQAAARGMDGSQVPEA